jgi:hypothetical protein
MTTATNPSNSNKGTKDASALVLATSIEIASPRVLALVERYKGFAKTSTENFVEMAKTLATADIELSPEDLNIFCDNVGLDPKGSTYRKLVLIGQKADRFEPNLAKLPPAWTTVYDLAKLSDKEFGKVQNDQRFSPLMTAKTIKAIVEPNSPKPKQATKIELKPSDRAPALPPKDSDQDAPDVQVMSADEALITLVLSRLNAQEKRQVLAEIQILQGDYDFEIRLSEDYRTFLERPSDAVSAESAFQMEQAA